MSDQYNIPTPEEWRDRMPMPDKAVKAILSAMENYPYQTTWTVPVYGGSRDELAASILHAREVFKERGWRVTPVGEVRDISDPRDYSRGAPWMQKVTVSPLSGGA